MFFLSYEICNNPSFDRKRIIAITIEVDWVGRYLATRLPAYDSLPCLPMALRNGGRMDCQRFDGEGTRGEVEEENSIGSSEILGKGSQGERGLGRATVRAGGI